MSNDVDAFVEFESAGFTAKAAAYHHRFGAVTAEFADPLLDAVAVKPGARLLDLATGPGQVAARAVDRGADVVGMDVSTGMVELARRLHAGIEFRVGDAHRLPVPDASFDVVVGNLLVPHLADHAVAVAEMRRVLVDGGRLALSTWDVPFRSPFPGALFLAVEEVGAHPPEGLPPGPPFYRYAEDEAFAALLVDAGLTDVEVGAATATYRVPSDDVAWESLLEASVRASALVEGQDAATKRRIRQAFDRVLAPYAMPGGLEVPMVVKVASGHS